MTGRWRSLTARLVLTAVLLALAVSVLLGVATTLSMRHALTERLDDDVRATLARTVDGPDDGDRDGPPGGPSPIDLRNQGPGTLLAVLGGDLGSDGIVVGRGPGEREDLDDEDLAELAALPPGDGVRTVRLDDLGGYRVAAADLGAQVLVVGLPSDEVDEAVGQLVVAELLLGLVAVVLAGGAAAVVVRRQLRPLHDVAATAHRVAALPLDSGDIELADRVPERLTDERTEVGQVGAALNTLLAHVESSLSARHRSEQQVRQFVADASHELRTPLATLAGYSELARRRPDDPDAQRTALAKVEEESARMTALVEDLLLLARLDSGRPLAREPVDLTQLLLEAVDDARVLAPDHRWRLELPEEVVEVTGDAARLHQVVTNLLTNARRYTPPGSTVTVSADPGGFSVRDDGPGFPPDLLDRAFERFTRGDEARTRTGEQSGLGLGLSLVRAIVAAHGGTVTLRSVPGETVVDVRLP